VISHDLLLTCRGEWCGVICKNNLNTVEETAWELMEDGYDLHIHSLPSVFPRSLDCFELVREASEAKMAGVVLKSHYESTAFRAALVNAYSNCSTKAYGAIALNWPVGGLNVYAVENALKAGAKIVWMPTRDAANSLMFGNMDGDFFNRPGISILTSKGTLKESVYDIMDVVKKYNRVLATGHISPNESVILCKEGRKRGVRMILTHPEFPRTTMDAEIQKEMADLGVLIEKNWYNVAQKAVTIEQMAANIRAVGVKRAFLSTDRGQKGLPHPTIELHNFVAALLKQGFSETEIRSLVRDVPKSIIE